MNDKDFSENPNYFEKKIYSEDDKYILTMNINESSNISMNCKLEDNAIALYDYSMEISLEELYNKSYVFKQCKNINEIFILLKNVIKGISITDNDYYSSRTVKSSTTLEAKDNILNMILEIPLLTKEIEKVNLVVKKNMLIINLKF